MKIADITKEIMGLEKVYILVHVSPDGDALGSSLALCEFLRTQGKTADVVLEAPVPEGYAFMNPQALSIAEAKQPRDVIVLDCGDLARTGLAREVYDRSGKKVVVDHHATNSGFGDICLVMGDMSSTGEIICRIIEETGCGFNERIAFLLYSAIMSDTGGLRYSCATPETVRTVAKLMEYDIDTAYINRMLFENNPLYKIKLKGMVISTLKVACQGKMAMVHVTKEMLAQAGATDESTEGFVNIPRSVEGVEIGVFLKEREGEIRVSLRSNAYADVSRIAAQLGGGGHFHAGGCSVKGSMEEAEKIITRKAEELLQGK